ncbi:MAG: RHS repeat-associated core domain-containing protein [Burkholderiaceae bacterium]
MNRTVAWSYNALGNILNQTEVGAYQYNPSGAGSSRPHAVVQVNGTTVTPSGRDGFFTNPRYSYDVNGNLTVVSDTTKNRVHTWTSFNMPRSIATTGSGAGAGASAAFLYDSGYGRVKQTFARIVNAAVKTRTVYTLHPDQSGGLSYEREIKEDGSIEHRHYVMGSIVLISTTDGATQSKITSQRYWHTDPQGTVVAVSDKTGAVIERLSHDPFGKRRNITGQADPSNLLRSVNNDRGYTGHEQLDELGLIHMNGRIYDPAIGKFLSADPIIQAADNLQSYNRYAYVINNPMNATDPTGFSWFTKLRDRVVKPVAIGFISYYTAGLLTGPLASAFSLSAFATNVTTAFIGGTIFGQLSGENLIAA